MDIPLLATKFYVPKPVAGTVSRPRLLDRLQKGIDHKLTCISAPAGFGKTMLLSEWIGRSARPACWLSLDAHENDPAQFWLYFIGALQRIDSRVGEVAVNILQMQPPPTSQLVLTTLINEISDKLPEFLIVLDDYHLIGARPIHDAVIFLLDHLPPNMHLAIAGRADPPLPLSRLRANSQLTELRADDLRFTQEETEALFHKLTVTGLSEEDVSALVARTEGWIVGLQMAALSIQNREDRSKFIDSFGGSNRYVLDYLVDEVLNRQEEVVQSFLLQTSILERMNGSLCDAITGRNDGQQMLERLEAANLFVTPLDDERRWYRYHHLFAELLRSLLMKTQTDLPKALYQRASSWFETNGLAAEAVNYSLAGEDPERAASLSESVAMQLSVQNRGATVFEWMSRIPEDVLMRHPKLCVTGAWAALSMRRFDDVAKLIQLASTHLSPREPDNMDPNGRYVYSHILALRAFLDRATGEFGSSIEQSLEAIKYAGDADQILLSTAALNLGVSYWHNGNLKSARDHIEKAAEQAEKAGNYFFTLTSMSFLAEIEAEFGHLAKAARICERAIELGTRWGGGHPIPTTGYALVALSQVLREWNRLADAEAVLSQGLQLGEASTEADVVVRAYLALARLKSARGDFDAVADAFKKAYSVEPVFAYLRNQISALEAREWLTQGKLDQAVKWANAQEFQPVPTAHMDLAREVQYLTILRIRLAEGKAEEVLAPLEALRVGMETQERTVGELEVLVLQSLALKQLGKTDEAMATFEQALRLAEPEGYVRIFGDHGAAMLQLLRDADRKGIARDYVRVLLRVFQSDEQKEVSAGGLLNEQEKAILRLIASGRSNREISEELYLSLNTIKWYSSQIYGKLGVSSRAEAVERAHDLNIL